MAQTSERLKEFGSPEPSRPPERKTVKVVGRGMTTSAFIGIGAFALGILGIVGVIPLTLLEIAVIAIGGAMMLEGGAFAARFNDAVHSISRDRNEEISVEAGISADILGGISAVALGILALVGITPLTLVSIGIIVIGASRSMDVLPKARMNSLVSSNFEPNLYNRSSSAVMAGAGGQFLLSISVLALGILALVGIAPVTLNLVAIIAAGAAILFESGVVGYRSLRSL